MNDCDNLTIQDRCTNRHTAGRAPFSAPVAIVLWTLNRNIEQFNAETQTPANPAYYTPDVKSVHFAITHQGGVIQYVAEQNTAWALSSYNNPGWPLLGSLPYHADPNAPYLHVAVEGSTASVIPGCPPIPTAQQLATLKALLCCLCLNHNIPADSLHILVGEDLDDRVQGGFGSVPPNLIAEVAACGAAGGLAALAPPPPNINSIIASLQACCASNTAAITALQASLSTVVAQLANLSTRVSTLEAGQAAAQAAIANMQSVVGPLAGQITAINQILAHHSECIECLCPKPLPIAPIHYQLIGPTQRQPLTPQIPVWLNPATQLADTIPPSVLPGPMWSAALDDPCVYNIGVTVRLTSGNFCVGSKVWIDLIACGTQSRIGEITIAAGGPQVVTVTGNGPLAVPPACNDVHFLIGTDETSDPTYFIEYADVTITCA